MNRGSRLLYTDFDSVDCCFNEAPIHESGKSCAWRGPCPGSRRFNEAPIHESGKCRPHRPRWAGGSRFNEAPIHESGKLALTGIAHWQRSTLQ